MSAMHICRTSDGADIPCMCIHGSDHDEADFDVPPGGFAESYDDD